MRKALSILFMSVTSLTLSATTLVDMANALKSKSCVQGTAEYEVSLPSSPDPVKYTIRLMCSTDGADILAPCQYLIDWTLPRQRGDSHGFSAYFDGNHFRYHDNKLQEYHTADDAVPFHIGTGVQNQAQFAELLPPYLAQTLEQMATDSTYIYTIRQNGNAINVEGKRRVKGYDAFEFDYVFDAKTCMPISADFTYNPASISEQIVTAYYTWQERPECPTLSESYLISLYPEVFEKFRTSNFRVENLTGTFLPEFTARRTDNERYIHHHDDSFQRPTLLVFIDPAVESAVATVNDIRQAIEQSATDFDVLYLVADNVVSTDIFGDNSDPAETVLTSARKLVRECGITAYPTLIFADRTGKVQDVLTSYNKELPTVVIQKMMLCN